MVKYKLKDLFNLFAGGDIDIEHFSQYKTPVHCFPIYSNSLNNKGLYGYTSVPKYKGNSITITGRGSVGHAEYRKQDFDAIIRLLVLIPKKSNIVNPYYLTQFINQYVSFPLESTGVPQLTVPQIENIEVALPDYTQQVATAEALSDIDSLLSSLQKLIEKNKAIKQGAMQELLTGKKRLPGFSEKWRVVRIGETLSIGHGQSQKAVENRFGKYPILATGGCIGYANDFLWNKPSVLIGRKGTIDKPQYADYPFWTIDTLFYTRIFDEYDAKFVYYKFCMIDWQQYNEASGVPSLNATTIENLQIIVPEKDEQQAIAQLLSDMDSEIDQMEKKLAKYQQIKQGMMQELLTGRIRLV